MKSDKIIIMTTTVEDLKAKKRKCKFTPWSCLRFVSFLSAGFGRDSKCLLEFCKNLHLKRVWVSHLIYSAVSPPAKCLPAHPQNSCKCFFSKQTGRFADSVSLSLTRVSSLVNGEHQHLCFWIVSPFSPRLILIRELSKLKRKGGRGSLLWKWTKLITPPPHSHVFNPFLW